MKKKILTISLVSVFSIILWIFVSLSNEYFTTINLQLKFVDIPKGYMITEKSSEGITLSLKGQGWLLAQITFGRDPKFEINVKNKKGKQSELVRNSLPLNSWLSSSLQITEISPNILTFNIEKLYEKKVKVNPDVSLAPKEGFGIVSNVEIEPDSVLMRGPKNKLEGLKFVTTENTSFTNLDTDLMSDIRISKINDIQIIPGIVKVTANVQKIVDKHIDGVVVSKRNVPRNQQLEIIPTSIQVVLRGGINKLAAVKSTDITAYVDFMQALKDTLGAIKPVVKSIEFTEVLSIKPNRLKYIIKKY